MYDYKNILCLIVIFAISYATKKNPPLKQLEGPWMIRNASENALSIIGNCPSMEIEPSHEKSSSEGIILFKTKVHTYTLTVVNMDQKMYQLFYMNDSGAALLGNVSLLHVEKSTFLITELQTEGQIYYAVLTKENQTTPDIHKKIDKIWKSSKPAKSVSLAPTEYENCQNSQEEINENNESGESTINPIANTTEAGSMTPNEIFDVSISIHTSEKIPNGGVNNTPEETSPTDSQKPWIEEKKSTAVINSASTDSLSTSKYISISTTTSSISTSESSQASPDKPHTLPIVEATGNTNKTKMRNSAQSNMLYSSDLSATLGLVFLLIIKTIII